MSKPLTAPTRRPIRCAAVRPNLGVQEAYQRRLDALIAQMHRSVARAVAATYRRKTPILAQDESSPVALRETLERLAREWTDKFDEFANGGGRKFSRDAIGSADRAFAASLKKAGFTVDFKLSPAANEVMQATIAEQVNLIRSIPAQHLTQVQGAVMRSVTAGRDAASLAREVEAQYGVTKRRAALIARDQNNKATAAITRARQDEIGVTQAVWIHSAGGRQPRPEHVKANGKVYDVKKGMFLEGKWTWPGVEINCRCISRSIIPGLE
jgi:SPP1 gp7 family putative phage head morphogenesis protein